MIRFGPRAAGARAPTAGLVAPRAAHQTASTAASLDLGQSTPATTGRWLPVAMPALHNPARTPARAWLLARDALASRRRRSERCRTRGGTDRLRQRWLAIARLGDKVEGAREIVRRPPAPVAQGRHLDPEPRLEQAQ